MSDELFAMVTSGKVRIDPPRTYALADAALAHRDLESRATTGASVLIP
jgi:NADPH2:quinone reductase